MDALITSLTTAFSGVSTNVMSILAVALPAAIGIVATIMAIKIGVKFFRSIAGN